MYPNASVALEAELVRLPEAELVRLRDREIVDSLFALFTLAAEMGLPAGQHSSHP